MFGHGDINGYVGTTSVPATLRLDLWIRCYGRTINSLRLKRASGFPVFISARKCLLRVWNLLVTHLGQRIWKVEPQPGVNFVAAQFVER